MLNSTSVSETQSVTLNHFELYIAFIENIVILIQTQFITKANSGRQGLSRITR